MPLIDFKITGCRGRLEYTLNRSPASYRDRQLFNHTLIPKGNLRHLTLQGRIPECPEKTHTNVGRIFRRPLAKMRISTNNLQPAVPPCCPSVF